jgi:hypothetical protein
MTSCSVMTCCSRVLLLLLLAWTSNAAVANESSIRLVLPDDEPAWVGEPVRFQLELAVKGQFAGATVFDLPKIRGAILMQSGDRPVLGSETIDGEAWTTQLHDFILFSQKGGSVAVPPINARFGMRSRFDAPQQSLVLQSDAFQRTMRSPPGIAPGIPVAAVHKLEANEEWDLEDADSLRQGDAVRRTIRSSASDYPAMLLPVPDFVPDTGLADGLAAYPDDPDISDRVDRGDWASERVDSVVYVFEEAGQFELPAITLRWWDPQAGDWQEQGFPARQFEVAASGLAPGEDSGQPANEPGYSLAPWLILAAVLAVGGWFGWWLRRPLASLWAQWQQRDAARISKLLKLARSGTAVEVYAACRGLLAELGGTTPPAARVRLQPHLLELQEVIIGNRQGFDRQALVRAVKEIHKANHRAGKSRGSDLPVTLNPNSPLPH